MNSFTGSKSQRASSSSSSTTISFDSYQFDFGFGSKSSSSSRPIKDQKLNPNPPSSFPSSTPAAPSPAARPSWIHQPSNPARSALPNPSPSMVGDIFGRNWSSMDSQSSKLGIQDKNPNLFSDLVGSAIGQGRSSHNVPLKSTPVKNSMFSMADLKSSVPNVGNPSSNSTGSFSSFVQSGPNVKSDPFGSLMGFQSKTSGGVQKSQQNAESNDIGVSKLNGDGMDLKSSVPKVSKPSSNSTGSFSSFVQSGPNVKSDPFGSLMGFQSNTSGGVQESQQNAESNDIGVSKLNGDGMDLLNVLLFSSSSASFVGDSLESKRIVETNDWEFGSEIGGGTTELEGLGPPPVGVTASAAKVKGLDCYKHGQYADAIKWLSWAFVLMEKAGNVDSSTEVLICRASCYKEVGEHKKAIADCSKVLEHDSSNVAVLLQRALLYESSEKYRLGAEDLRAVLKIDPSNRLARSTIHRMAQFAD